MLTSKNPAASEFPDGLGVRDEVTSILETDSTYSISLPPEDEAGYRFFVSTGDPQEDLYASGKKLRKGLLKSFVESTGERVLRKSAETEGPTSLVYVARKGSLFEPAIANHILRNGSENIVNSITENHVAVGYDFTKSIPELRDYIEKEMGEFADKGRVLKILAKNINNPQVTELIEYFSGLLEKQNPNHVIFLDDQQVSGTTQIVLAFALSQAQKQHRLQSGSNAKVSFEHINCHNWEDKPIRQIEFAVKSSLPISKFFGEHPRRDQISEYEEEIYRVARVILGGGVESLNSEYGISLGLNKVNELTFSIGSEKVKINTRDITEEFKNELHGILN